MTYWHSYLADARDSTLNHDLKPSGVSINMHGPSRCERHEAVDCRCVPCATELRLSGLPLLELLRRHSDARLQGSSGNSLEQTTAVPTMPTTGYDRPTGSLSSTLQDDSLFQVYEAASLIAVKEGLHLYARSLKMSILESQKSRDDISSRSPLCFYRDDPKHIAWLKSLSERLSPDAGVGEAAYSRNDDPLDLFIDNALVPNAAFIGLGVEGSSARLHCALSVCAGQWADYVFAADAFGDATAEIFQPLTPFLLWWADYGRYDRTGEMLKLCVAISIENEEKRTVKVPPTVIETLSARTYDAGVHACLALYDGADLCGCADLPAVNGAAFSAVLHDYFDLISDVRHVAPQNSILDCVSAGIDPWTMHRYVLTGCLWSLISPTCRGYMYMGWLAAQVQSPRWRGDMVRLDHLFSASEAWCSVQEAGLLQRALRAPKLPTELLGVPWHIAVSQALETQVASTSLCRTASAWTTLRDAIRMQLTTWDGSYTPETLPSKTQNRAFLDAFFSGMDGDCTAAQASSIVTALKRGWLQSGAVMREFINLNDC